jgi:UDP-N-acetylmuramoylalanine--D-glutamate ligase
VLAKKVSALVLMGRDAPQIAVAVGETVPVHWAQDMDQAVALAAQLAQPGDSVLLSPACASYDMFSNYEERGAAFAAAVQRQFGLGSGLSISDPESIEER